MRTNKMTSKNTTLLYILAIVVIVIVFILLGGATWMKGLMHTSHSFDIGEWSWGQVLISLGIGFILGFIVAKRT